MKRTAIAAIALGVGLFAAPQAQAGVDVAVGIRVGQGYRYDRYDRFDRRYDVRRIAFDNGYRDGLRQGERDDRRDDRYSYRDEWQYRRGDSGYRREYGSRSDYMRAYRDGFEDGYRRGYANRRSRFDRRRY